MVTKFALRYITIQFKSRMKTIEEFNSRLLVELMPMDGKYNIKKAKILVACSKNFHDDEKNKHEVHICLLFKADLIYFRLSKDNEAQLAVDKSLGMKETNLNWMTLCQFIENIKTSLSLNMIMLSECSIMLNYEEQIFRIHWSLCKRQYDSETSRRTDYTNRTQIRYTGLNLSLIDHNTNEWNEPWLNKILFQTETETTTKYRSTNTTLNEVGILVDHSIDKMNETCLLEIETEDTTENRALNFGFRETLVDHNTNIKWNETCLSKLLYETKAEPTMSCTEYRSLNTRFNVERTLVDHKTNKWNETWRILESLLETETKDTTENRALNLLFNLVKTLVDHYTNDKLNEACLSKLLFETETEASITCISFTEYGSLNSRFTLEGTLLDHKSNKWIQTGLSILKRLLETRATTELQKFCSKFCDFSLAEITSKTWKNNDARKNKSNDANTLVNCENINVIKEGCDLIAIFDPKICMYEEDDILKCMVRSFSDLEHQLLSLLDTKRKFVIEICKYTNYFNYDKNVSILTHLESNNFQTARNVKHCIETTTSIVHTHIWKNILQSENTIETDNQFIIQFMQQLYGCLISLILHISIAYNLLYVIPNKLYSTITSKQLHLKFLCLTFVLISSKYFYFGYSNRHKDKKIKTLNKTIPVPLVNNNIDKIVKRVKNGKIKNTKQLLYDIIHYDGLKQLNGFHAYPVSRGDFSDELVRVGTLSTFPDENSPSLIRLAASGFYYDGKGRELKCFSCGLAYDAWSSSTIPLDIHRQLSPDCPYIKERFSAQTDNETDSFRNRALCTDTNREVPALLTSSSALPVIVTNGPDSALGDSLSEGNSCRSSRRGYSSSLVTSSSRSSAYSSGYISQGSSGLSSGNQNSSSNGTPRSPLQLPTLAEDSEPTSGRSSNRNSTSQPNSSRNIPPMKYPEYQTPEKRFATYKDWPSHLTFLYPRDLVECGFFYSNFGDCVRCFHCGIGLRNWEEDDNPWVEHARWSRKCPYLIQRKGQEFIDSVLSVLGLQTDAEIEAQISNATTDRPSQPRSSSNDVRDPITHPAAKYVITERIFGENIDRKRVKKAMNQLIQAHDWESITNDMLVNIMLENKNGAEFMDTNTSTNTSAEVQQINNNNPTPSNSKESQTKESSKNSASSDPEKVQKENEEIKDLYTCKICLDERVGITFVPCGHLVTCKNCSPKIRRCPLCRTFIRGTIKTTV